MMEQSTQNITSEEKESYESNIKESVVVSRYKIYYSFTTCANCGTVHDSEKEYEAYICQNCNFDHTSFKIEMQNNVDRIANEQIDLNKVMEDLQYFKVRVEELDELEEELHEAKKKIEKCLSLDDEQKDVIEALESKIYEVSQANIELMNEKNNDKIKEKTIEKLELGIRNQNFMLNATRYYGAFLEKQVYGFED